jgi:hypothetical protein
LLKANWGRFHHNTGNASGTVNPLASATATFDWIDANGDKQFTPNEFGQNRAVTGVGGVSTSIDPDIKDPYTDSMSFWFERELASNIGLRAGYTFRTDRNNSEAVELARVYSLFTLARTFRDPGVDGILGNGDDGPDFTWWDIPGQAPPARTETRTVAEELADDAAIDVTLSKRMSDRWSLVTSYYYNWDRDVRYVQTPNQERFADDTVTNWNFKVFGTYQAPWGVVATGSLRHQSGGPISRDVLAQGQPGQNVTAAGTNANPAYEAEPNNAYRTDNVTVLDAKIERRFRFGNRSLSAFVDAFNITNTNAADVGQQSSIVGRPTVTLADGSRVQVQGFLRPTAIVPPRIFRFGARLSF